MYECTDAYEIGEKESVNVSVVFREKVPFMNNGICKFGIPKTRIMHGVLLNWALMLGALILSALTAYSR